MCDGKTGMSEEAYLFSMARSLARLTGPAFDVE